MHNLDDRWPDELDAGDPRLADVMRDDPSVQVYSEPSRLRMADAEQEHQVESDRAAEMLVLCILLACMVAAGVAGWLL
ncbi:MAG: hypothetical protein KGL35_03320 [Bradyrhizobium sp.]|nr:hypothetical protein [Bradyrhizobium sp.]